MEFLLSFFIIKSKKICWQILLQDKYNIAIARLSLISKPRHINSIFTVNTPILYIYHAIV